MPRARSITPPRVPKVAEASRLSSSQHQKQDASATLSPAPKGRNIPAQGNALGSRHPTNQSPEPERSGDRLPGFPGSPEGVTSGNQRAAQGWRIVKLEDVAESIQYGHTASSTQEAVGPRFLRITDIQDRRVEWETVPYCSIPKNQVSKYRLAKGDLLFARTGATVGKSFLITTEIPESIFASYLIRVRVTDAVDPQFIAYYFQSAQYWQQISDNSSGIGQPNVNGSKLAKITFPLPPLPEQRRIVARIEELFSRLDAGVTALRHAKAQLQRYRQSVLAAAVTGQLTQAWREQHRETEPAEELLKRILKQRREQWIGKGKYKEPVGYSGENPFDTPPSWALTNFEQVSRRVTVGHVGSMKDEYTESGVPFLRGQNVRANRFDPNGLKFVSREFHQSLSKSLIRGGDIAVTRSGDVGIACVIPEELGEANCSDLVLIQGPVLIDPNFAAYYMNSLGRRLVQEGKVGVAITHFNTQAVAAMPLPLPPLAEQHQIVAEVEARTTAIDHLEADLDRQITRSNRLRQSTLNFAFRGKLA